jgi:hypothetical protein
MGLGILDIATGAYDDGDVGDELVVIRGAPGTSKHQKLYIYDMPTGVGGNTEPPIGSDRKIGKTNSHLTVGDFDGGGDRELALVRYVEGRDIYRLYIYELPIGVGGDTGPAIASDRNIGSGIVGIASANFDDDPEEELVVVRLVQSSGKHRLEVYDVPVTLGGDLGTPIASDRNIGKNIIPYGLAAGNFDQDSEAEIAVVQSVGSGNHKLIIYDAPGSVGGDTGPPIATASDIGKDITAIGVGIVR